jgi:hypothetical protein
MKTKHDELSNLQIDLRDSVEYDNAVDMFVNLVEALNHVGKPNEALVYQEIIVRLVEARKQVLSIPNPGITFGEYRYKTK